MEDLTEQYQNLPDIDKCKISILYAHNRQRLKDGTVKEQIQRRAYVKTKPFSQHKKFVITLVKNLSNKDSETFINSVNWDPYIHKKLLDKIITAMTNEQFEQFFESIDWEQYLEKKS